jgi:ABC-2 type transport system ATP-binding protein
MTAVLEAQNLGKRFGRKWALSNCTLSIPSGHVVGLVGPNGAGKSTLLNLAVGLLAPSRGTINTFGHRPATNAAQLAQVGFVAQDTPTYPGLSIADHLKLGARMNSTWDDQLAKSRIKFLGLNPRQKAGKLSGGQRAQLALTLAIAKRPEVLILDEPVASLDPLARREFLQTLMETVAGGDLSVVLSSHLVADIERVCDYLIILVSSRVQVAGELEDLLTSHHRLIGPADEPPALLENQRIIEESGTAKQRTLIVRSDGPILDPRWSIEPVNLEDLVLAYMGQGKSADASPRDESESRE